MLEKASQQEFMDNVPVKSTKDTSRSTNPLGLVQVWKLRTGIVARFWVPIVFAFWVSIDVALQQHRYHTRRWTLLLLHACWWILDLRLMQAWMTWRYHDICDCLSHMFKSWCARLIWVIKGRSYNARCILPWILCKTKHCWVKHCWIFYTYTCESDKGGHIVLLLSTLHSVCEFRNTGLWQSHNVPSSLAVKQTQCELSRQIEHQSQPPLFVFFA